MLVDSTEPVARQRADATRNREALLHAAAEAFTQAGVDVPLASIAAHAGVGVGTLYRHFPSRHALVEAAYRHEVDRLCAAAPALLTSFRGDEALQRWMERFVEYVATKRGMADALRSAVCSDSPLFAHSRERMTSALGTLLAAGASDGSLRPDSDPEDVMRAMGGVWLVSEGPDWRDPARRLLRLLVDGLRYREPQATSPRPA